MMSTHINHSTRKEYQGGNVAELEDFRAKNEYESAEWLTYRQALSIGRQVRKGQHGCKIKKIVEFEDQTKAARGYTVFNLEQTDLIEGAV